MNLKDKILMIDHLNVFQNMVIQLTTIKIIMDDEM